MTPKDPFLEGTFWDKFWRPIRSRALLFTPEIQVKNYLFKPENNYLGNFCRSDSKTHATRPWPLHERISANYLWGCTGAKEVLGATKGSWETLLNQSNLSGDTFSIEVPQYLLRTKTRL